MRHETFDDGQYRDAYEAASHEILTGQQRVHAQITPEIQSAYDRVNEMYPDLPPVSPHLMQKQTVSAREESTRSLRGAGWAAGALVIVLAAGASAGYKHFTKNEEDSVQQGMTANFSSNRIDNIEDRCYEDPTLPSRTNGLKVNGNTVRVTKDINQVVYGAAGGHMIINEGVHIGLAALCGAEATLEVHGRADTVVLLGAVTDLKADDVKSIGGGVVEGGGCRVEDDAAQVVVAPTCDTY